MPNAFLHEIVGSVAIFTVIVVHCVMKLSLENERPKITTI